jgi:steroid 5-alpha reductase family enzyme
VGNSALWLGISAFALWLLSVKIRDVSIVDIYWAPAYSIACAAIWTGEVELSPARWGLVFLVAAWGLRLGGYLAWRNLGHGEDRRYQAIRAGMEPGFWWKSLFVVFGFQSFLVWCISMPVQFALQSEVQPTLWALALGGTGYALGFFFEAVGDLQLARFLARPDSAGQVMNEGLWRYSRHPNYFGNCCLWWGLYLFSVGLGAPWWTVFSPILMTVLLLRVSGVSLLERTITSRRPGYAEYVRRTSAFIPRPPKS